jgi:hypothetical protein
MSRGLGDHVTSPNSRLLWPGDLDITVFMISLAAAIAGGRHIIGPPSAGLGDGYITIGHGILDPPQLFMQNKAADCATKELSVCCLLFDGCDCAWTPYIVM